MAAAISFVLLALCFRHADLADSAACRFEMGCVECTGEYAPLVTSAEGAGAGEGGAVRAAEGAEVRLWCGEAHFALFPERREVRARCEGGRLRLRDGSLRHLLDLGCQQNVFEDVQHEVEECGGGLQGRAYVVRGEGGAWRHLAAVCFDAERATPLRLHTSSGARLALPAHAERAAPLSLLGNFNHMFDASTRRDAELLFADEARLGRRLREMFAADGYEFEERPLAAAALLSALYFEGQEARVADMASNKAVVWRAVADGNLRRLQRDVARLAARRRVEVYAGTHGVAALGGRGVFLRAGGRFPVPAYVWTAVLEPARDAAVALAVLNDPWVAAGDERAAAPCRSACPAAAWLRDLLRHRNYERPAYGLVFCCSLQDFAAVFGEMPKLYNSTTQMLN